MSGDGKNPFLCPECEAPWHDDNIVLLDLDAGDHCEDGRFYSERCNVMLQCHACKVVLWRKKDSEFG